MALTTLDPNTALAVIDLQKGIFDSMTDTRPHDYSTMNVFPRPGETGTSRKIIDLLLSRSA